MSCVPSTVYYEALLYAASQGHLPVVKVLLKFTTNVDKEDILLMAVRNGYLNVVDLLIQEGANIHVQEELPLKTAVQRGHFAVVRLLVDSGALVHQMVDQLIALAGTNNTPDQSAIVEFLERFRSF